MIICFIIVSIPRTSKVTKWNEFYYKKQYFKFNVIKIKQLFLTFVYNTFEIHYLFRKTKIPKTINVPNTTSPKIKTLFSHINPDAPHFFALPVTVWHMTGPKQKSIYIYFNNSNILKSDLKSSHLLKSTLTSFHYEWQNRYLKFPYRMVSMKNDFFCNGPFVTCSLDFLLGANGES